MGDYQEILEDYLSLRDSSNQLFEKSLEEPVMIKSRTPGEPSYEVTSISSLWLASYGNVLYIRDDEYMRVSTIPGWVRWDGCPVSNSEVYKEILSAAASGGFLAWMRPVRHSSKVY